MDINLGSYVEALFKGEGHNSNFRDHLDIEIAGISSSIICSSIFSCLVRVMGATEY